MSSALSPACDALFDAEDFFDPRPVTNIARLDQSGTQARLSTPQAVPGDGVLVAPCSRRAAEYSVLNWHYSRSMPCGDFAPFGVWESGRFIGAIIFGQGANRQLGTPYGLTLTTCTELTRVALREHHVPVSQVVANAVRLLRRTSPGLRLIVSFADPVHGHHGGVYQAGNWVYLGTSSDPRAGFIINGNQVHRREVACLLRGRLRYPGETELQRVRRTLDPGATAFRPGPKHRYVYPLDRAMRRKLEPLAQAYPRRPADRSTD